MTFETERLLLRPWKEEDAQTLYKYASDPDIGPPAGWRVHESTDDSLNILKTVLMNEATWAVCIKDIDEPVGSIGYFPCGVPEAKRQPEVGYWIAKPFWGRGYIPEAVRFLSAWLFENGAGEVWCGHYEGNEKSRRVIEKCGFKFRLSRVEEVPLLNEHRLSLFYSIDREAAEK